MKINKILFFFAAFSSVGIFAQGSAPAEKKWHDKVDISGYVDVYYNWTSNNKQGAQQDTAGTFHQYNKQFAVNAVKLSAEKVAKSESPWGFRLDMQNGQNIMYQERPYQSANSLHNMQLLQQAYVSMFFNVKGTKGLTVDIGKMATHIGNEVLDSKDNINYTIGYIFYNTIPFIHTGARAKLVVNDRLSLSLLLYNSAQGTGYTGNGCQFGQAAAGQAGLSGCTANPLNQNQVFGTGHHSYADGPNPLKAGGTQVKYFVMPEKFQVVWNTLYGNDNQQSRLSDSQFYLSQQGINGLVPGGQQTVQAQPSRNRIDYWFINHMSFIFTPTTKSFILLDYTFGQRSGYANDNSFGYLSSGNSGGIPIDSNRNGVVETNGSDLRLRTEPQNIIRIYKTYGIWAKYEFTDKFALAARYEHIDDSKYGGSLTVNQATFAQTPRDRLDLMAADGNYTSSRFGGLGRAASNYGMIQTFTLTPTYKFTENLLIKLDIRRDWGPGRQFIDQAGRATPGQNGLILGIVAMF
jgi:hypothetical protein